MKTSRRGFLSFPAARTLSYIACSTLLLVACLTFWLMGHPELMSYHEQYQLFLFNRDYFVERISEVGGLADYISEFIVQFYYVPWAGATLIATLSVLMQVLLAASCFTIGVRDDLKITVYAISALPTVLLMYYMGDINLLLSYPVAIVFTLFVTWLTLAIAGRGGHTHHTHLREQQYLLLLPVLIIFMAIYWAVGPVALLYPLLVSILRTNLRRPWIWAAVSFATSCLIVMAINRLWFAQYPESQMFFGINYYRVTNIHPVSVFVTAAAVLIVAVVARLFVSIRRQLSASISWCVFTVIVIVGICVVPKGYDTEEMEVLRYDMLVRNERWHDIIAMAERKEPTNEFGLQALNLALAKTGQLGDRMFEFDQSGIGGLISKYYYDNTSCLVSAEVFYHLGMINSAFRYNFDMQEATMNDRKSGRFLKRMAECMIINQQYGVAAKYINKLKDSLFYGDWAKRAEAYYKDGDKTDQVPIWAHKRQLRYKQEMLYDYEEIEKMLGLLALCSEGKNLLAWDYFNAALLLKGDLQTMTGMYHYAKEDFNLYSIPEHHQQAIGMFWTFGHQSFDGLPYQISEAVQRDIANLAQVYSKNIDRPEVWKKQFKGNYCVYFLERQSAAQQSTQTTPSKGSEREG